MCRRCVYCQESIEHKRKGAIYCNPTCKKAYYHKRDSADPAYRQANRERSKAWRKDNLDRSRTVVAQWHKDNPEKSSYHKAKYHYRKKDATPDKRYLDDMASLHSICRKLERVSPIKYHVDHIVPLQGENVCGLNVPWNLQILPAQTNIRKSNKCDGVENRPFSKLGKAGSIFYDHETTVLEELAFNV